MIASAPPSTLRAGSVSSIRRRKVPPCSSAKLRFATALRAPPRCSDPVGLGAKRTRTTFERTLRDVEAVEDDLREVGRRRDEHQDVLRGDIGAKHAGSLRALHELLDGVPELALLRRALAGLETLDQGEVGCIQHRNLPKEAGEPLPRIELVGCGKGNLGELADPLVEDRDDEIVLAREVAKDRAVPDARAPGDLVDRDVEPLLREALARYGEQTVEVALRVGAEGHPPIGTVSGC